MKHHTSTSGILPVYDNRQIFTCVSPAQPETKKRVYSRSPRQHAHQHERRRRPATNNVRPSAGASTMRVTHCKNGPCNPTVALVVRPSSRSNHSTPLVRRPFSFAGVSARRQADDSWICHRQSCGRSYPRRLVHSLLKLPHECPQGFGRHSLY
ncbi:unnamed protein product, partial [Ectocarpus sp. 8 AP-2014]